MAVRYSGDTEIRFLWDPRQGAYVGTVKDPYLRWVGTWRPPTPPGKGSDLFDEAAFQLFQLASRWAERAHGQEFVADTTGKRVNLRRVFQAPCPLAKRKKRT